MRVDQPSNMSAAGRITRVVPAVDGAVADERSFADWLASAATGEDLADDAERPFSNGTMRAVAQRFDADGLLKTGAVPAPEVADVEVQATAAAMPVAPAPVVAPDVVAPGAVPPVDEALPSAPGPSAAVGNDHTPSTLPTMPVAVATPRAVPVGRAGVATPVGAVRPLRFAAIASEPASAVWRSRVPVAPAVQVTLSDAENGVTVAIAGDVAPEDEAGVQQAVRRLLARHGLTLGDTRFVRRVGGGRQQGER